MQPGSKTPSDYSRRILSFDGGPAALVHIRLLESIHPPPHQPHFLEQTEVFAGTSSGAQMALFLAKQMEEGIPGGIALRNCVAFSNELIRAWQATPLRSLSRFIPGVRPLIENEPLRKVLEKHFGTMRLEDIKGRKVVVISVDEQACASRVFTNIPGYEGGRHMHVAERQVRLADAALASSAFPILQPMHRIGRSRYVDGGFIANNPTMSALACLLDEDIETMKGQSPADRIKGMRVLSLGARYQKGQEAQQSPGNSLLAWGITLASVLSPPQPQYRELNRGWFRWLVSPPLHLMNMMFQGSANEVDYQCQQFMKLANRRDYYQRVSTPLPQMNILTAILTRRVDSVIDLLDEFVRQLAPERALIERFLAHYWTDKAPKRRTLQAV